MTEPRPERPEPSTNALEGVARQLAEASLRDGLAAERSVAATYGGATSVPQTRNARSWPFLGAALLTVAAAFVAGRWLGSSEPSGSYTVAAAVESAEGLARDGRWEELPAALEAASTAAEHSGGAESLVRRLDRLTREWTTRQQAVAQDAWQLELERAIPPALFGSGQGVVDWAAADSELTEVFLRAGIGAGREDVAVSDLPFTPVVDDRLRFALDAWARVRRLAGGRTGAGEVLRTAIRLDPDPQRSSIRAAWFAEDDDALVRIAGSLLPKDTEVATLVCAARALRTRGLRDRSLWGHIKLQLFLEETCERYPEAPYAALELGQLFRELDKPWQALRYIHAARALQPESLALLREYLTLMAGGRLLPPYVAERETRLALEQFPGDPWLRRLLLRRELEIGLRIRLEDRMFFGADIWDTSAIGKGMELLGAWVESAPRPDRCATQATALAALGKFDAALAAAQKGITLAEGKRCSDPVLARLCQELGLARLRLGIDGAEPAFRRAVRLAPHEARSVWLLAGLLTPDRADEAEALLKASLDALPAQRHAGELRKRLVEVLLASGDLQRASELAQELVDASPSDPTARQILGRVLRRRGDLAGARDALQAAFDRLPLTDGRLMGRSVEVLEKLVQVVAEHEGHPAAVEVLERAMQRSLASAPAAGLRKPTPDPVLLLLLGRVHRDAGELQRAIDAWRAALDAGLDSGEVYTSIAAAYEERRELVTGLRWRERAVERWPADAGLRRGFAEAMLGAGRAVEALGEAERCRELAPERLWPRTLRFRALLAAREFATAAEEVRSILAEGREGAPLQDPGEPPFDRWGATFRVGTRLLNVDQEPAAAEPFLALAVELDVNVPEAWCNYAASIWKQGRPAEALPHMQRGHELGSRQGAAWSYPSARWVEQIEREAAAQKAAREGAGQASEPATGDGGR